jgi:predicted permease
MGGWRWLARRIRVLFRKDEAEREMDEEIRDHIEREAALNRAAGMTSEEARRRALVAFGGVERYREEVRDARGARIVDDLFQDARIALRGFRKEPSFTLAVLLTLGLGIGGNVAMFAILQASFFRALPYPQAERLVMGQVTWNGQIGSNVSGPDYFDYLERNRSFAALGAYTPFAPRRTLTGEGEPDRVSVMVASPEYFTALGVTPALGRTFTADEAEQDGPNVAVISHGLWERRFGGDAAVLGRAATLSGTPFTIVGVMPAGFRLAVDTDVWLPMQRGGAWAQARQFHNFILVGRLAEGVTVALAQEDVDRISASLAEEYPDTNRNKGLAITPLHDALLQSYETAMLTLVAAVAVLLLVACGNVAGLLLARGSARRGELAVRSVMGAGRGRLGRQLLTEHALLAAGAAGVGLALAVWIQKGILAFVSMEQLGPVEARLSPASVGFAVALSALSVALFGVLPAVSVARSDPASRLQAGLRTTAGRASTRFRSTLVVAQVALTAVLLVGSGLLIRSFEALRSVDLGFDSADLLTATVQIGSAKYPDATARTDFFRTLGERVRAIPGVEAVGFVNQIPVRNPGGNVRVDLPERFGTSGIFGQLAYQRFVLPGYFASIGIPLVAGRDLAYTDTPETPPAIVLSASLAGAIFGSDDPVGRAVGVDAGGDQPVTLEVVGVVGDVVTGNPRNPNRYAMYMSFTQQPGTGLGLVVRARGDMASASAAVRQVLRDMDPDVPLAEVGTLEGDVARALSTDKAIAVVLTLFAATALMLAAVGLYGVLAYQVTQRLHEIGIRIALGAGLGKVVSSVVWGGVRLVVVGLVLGIPGAWWASRLLQEMLFGVGSTDPLTYGGVIAFLAAVATAACLIPGIRAARVDPVEAFRRE